MALTDEQAQEISYAINELGRLLSPHGPTLTFRIIVSLLVLLGEDAPYENRIQIVHAVANGLRVPLSPSTALLNWEPPDKLVN